MAIAALVLGIIGVFACFTFVPSLLAFIFGLVAAKQIKRSGGATTGKGLALAGWILGLVGMLVGVGFYVLAANGTFDDAAGRKDAFDLKVGDCVNTTGLGNDVRIRSVPTKKCTDLHDSEVFFVGQLNPTRSRDFPGQDTVSSETEDACIEKFEGYVGVPPVDSELGIYYVSTDEIGWKSVRGKYVCLLQAESPTLTGSMKGSNR
jgi:hypothetical protein